MNQRQFKKKCNKQLSLMFKGLPCIACDSIFTCGHHLIPRTYAIGIDVMNMTPLCVSHHTMSQVCAPHSTCSLAVGRFNDFIKDNFPKHWDWWNENRSKKGIKVDYEEVLAGLKAINDKGREYLINLVFEN